MSLLLALGGGAATVTGTLAATLAGVTLTATGIVGGNSVTGTFNGSLDGCQLKAWVYGRPEYRVIVPADPRWSYVNQRGIPMTVTVSVRVVSVPIGPRRALIPSIPRVVIA